MSLVLQASQKNNVDAIEMILEHEPSAAKLFNTIGQTGLHVAAIWGNIEVASVLIKGGADLDAQNQFGVTPLASAVQSERLEMVKLLIEKGADPQIAAGNGMRPYQVAKTDEMRVALGAPSLKGHNAVLAAEPSALQKLLDNGLNVSEQDSDGDTVLHLAVQAAVEDSDVKATTTMLDMLLKDGSMALARAQRTHNDQGMMPLHIAAQGGNAAVCEALLQASQPSLINAVALQKDGLHNGQWGKKDASGKIVPLPSAGSTPLHLVVQVMHMHMMAVERAYGCTCVRRPSTWRCRRCRRCIYAYDGRGACMCSMHMYVPYA